MTTAADIKKLIAPILARHSDLALAKRYLVIKPVRHIVRGILIDRTSGKDGLTPFWTADFLAYPMAGVTVGSGSSWFPNVGHSFSTTQTDLAERLSAAIEDFALPKLRPVVSITDYVHHATEYVQNRINDLRPLSLEKLAIDLALGDLESAMSICEQQLPKEVAWRKSGFGHEIDHYLRIHPLVRDMNYRAIIDVLREWEADAVKRLALGAVWERTPFPIEETG
jgi:hypothetical protein